jgi:pantoate--beta-alanine ligase
MNLVRGVAEMQRLAEALRRRGRRIGIVPTMGYLHEGHLSLMRLARAHADSVIATIFVNPAQFAPDEDYSKYPRDPERDQALAASAGVEILFLPEERDIYPPGYVTYVEVERMTRVLEGKIRPAHFRGVTTIVAKLFNIIKPHVAVFGQKDAQQAAVIRHMVQDLNFDIEVMVGPTVREPDGLAMSSRNVYLSPERRAESVILYRSLRLAEGLITQGERICPVITREMLKLIHSSTPAAVDYISIADPATLEELTSLAPGGSALVSLAVRIGGVRLIDNIVVRVP